MKAFKAGVHGVLRVSAHGCETAGELLCAVVPAVNCLLAESRSVCWLKTRGFSGGGGRLLPHYLSLLCSFLQYVLHGIYGERLD